MRLELGGNRKSEVVFEFSAAPGIKEGPRVYASEVTLMSDPDANVLQLHLRVLGELTSQQADQLLTAIQVLGKTVESITEEYSE